MKKLMFAAAVAAMGAGAFASECAPEEIEVARIYQMQMNVYTTKGVIKSMNTGTACEPGSECLILRGKDKTVLRGYIYACQDLCKLDDYSDAFCDCKRKALFEGAGEEGNKNLTVNIMNFMGANFTDVEVNWAFEGTVVYDESRQQTYNLTGSGYGVLGSGATIFADKMSGYFAGTASPSFDLSTKATTATAACVCEPSSVLTCESYDELGYSSEDTVAFGSWKIKFNANVSKAYLAGKWNPLTAIKKAMK